MEREPVLDGNVLAGVFGELFRHDLTTATGTCGGCGAAGPLAQTVVYASAPGAVARCPGCGEVLLTVVAEDGRYWLGFDRLRCVEIRAAGSQRGPAPA